MIPKNSSNALYRKLETLASGESNDIEIQRLQALLYAAFDIMSTSQREEVLNDPAWKETFRPD